MSADFRYEIKFPLDDRRLIQARSWIASETHVSSRYPARVINSLYYDTADQRAVTDNLYGIAERTKYRLRWYDNGDYEQAQRVYFETKHRHGRLNRKHRVELTGLAERLGHLTHHQIRQELIQQMASSPQLGSISNRFPTLQVRYSREYFEDAQGIRVTLDRDIRFHLAPLNAKLYFGLGILHPCSVMEIKFTAALKPAVSGVIQRLNISPKRHSKYVAGLAAFGLATYY